MTQQPIVSEMVEGLDENLREAYEERAGIIEFDAGLSREHAECLALLTVLAGHPLALTGVSLHKVKFNQYVLAASRELVASRRLEVMGDVDLLKVVEGFGGVAVLSAFS